MIRPMMVAATMTLLLGAIVFGQDAPAPDPLAGKVPIKGSGRSAVAGVQAVIYEPETPAGVSEYQLGEFMKFEKARDDIGIKQKADSGQACRLSQRTMVLVIAPHLEPPRPSRTYSSASQFSRSLQSAASAGPPPLETLEVRVLDGPHKGKALFVPVDAVALLMDAPPPRVASKPRPKSRPAQAVPKVSLPPAEAQAQAAKDLAAGETLEKAGKSDAALKAYRALMKDYPDTPSAAKAKGYIKALTGRP
jgi:hypothetical protein